MRFLFTSVPMVGHFHAMVPYARALVERGHEVVFATGARFGEVVRRSGFGHAAAGLDHDASADVFPSLPEWPSIVERFQDPAVAQLHGFAEALAPRMLADLVPLAASWKPDVVVRDPVELGGYLAAELAGIPHATVVWGIYIGFQAAAAGAVHALRARQGLPDDPGLASLDRFLLLSAMPASWPYPECPVPRALHRFQVPPFDTSGEEVLPDWLARPASRPLVHVTLGTTFHRTPGIFGALLAALEGEDLDAVVTVGRTMDPAALGPLPGNVRVARYIPLSLLLPRCDAIVFHAGFNSIHSALWHGVPMVLTPLGAGDQPWNARRCESLGAGVMVEGQPPAPDALRLALRAVLREPATRSRARALGQEMRALPALPVAAEQLERLGRTRERSPGPA